MNLTRLLAGINRENIKEMVTFLRVFIGLMFIGLIYSGYLEYGFLAQPKIRSIFLECQN